MTRGFAIPLAILFALLCAILAVIAVASSMLLNLAVLYLLTVAVGVGGLVLLLSVLLFRRICTPAFRVRLWLLLIGAAAAVLLGIFGILLTLNSPVVVQLLVGFAAGAAGLTGASAFLVFLQLLDLRG